MTFIVSQLSQENQPTKTFHQAKMALNKEFDEKARINGLVGLIYYPVSSEGPMPHAQIEVEGRCYITTKGSHQREEYVSLEGKIHKANNGGIPFGRIGLCVTPKELRQLSANVTKNPTYNCMKGVSNALGSHTSVSIPFIFSNFPTFSAGYLCSKKWLGDHRITSIEWHQDGNTLGAIAKSILSTTFVGLEIYAFYAIHATAASVAAAAAVAIVNKITTLI